MHSVNTITDTELAIAEAMAEESASTQVAISRESNGLETELKGVVSYLSSIAAQANDSTYVLRYLDAMIDHSEMIASEVDKNADQRKNSPKYYRKIKECCEDHLDLHKYSLSQVAQILGWAARLVRYYKTKDKTASGQNSNGAKTAKKQTKAVEHSISKALQRPR